MFRHLIKQNYEGPFRLGILKGGQLGRMLVQSSMNYDIKSVVMDKDEHCPCRDFCSEFINGDVLDFGDVYLFGKKVDAISLEFEHINLQALEKLESEGLVICPSSRVIKIIQDKFLQKQFYESHQIPTAEFVSINNRSDVFKNKSFLPAVQKLRVSGYDGKGVKVLNTIDDIETAFDAPSILERKIEFVKEISVIAVRNASGNVATYPVVEMEFNHQAHLLNCLFAPAGISAAVEKKAKELAVKLVNDLAVVGLLAVEMFVTADEQVLVNEIAPRPHNSGHHTIEANVTSQFEQMLRATLNLPLGSTDILMPSVMFNLLGEEGYQGPANYIGIEEALGIPRVYVHLYGKKMTAPFRKMGHITVLDPDLQKAKEKALWLKQKIKVIA